MPAADRLERFCSGRPDMIRFGPAASGLQRAEVHLGTVAFEPHRHDTYAVGITTAGVQTFRYRGARRVCLPGQLHILHPDETHDGAAATGEGFGYRILYLRPELVRDALGGGSLPFVPDPVHGPTPTTRALALLLRDVTEPISELAAADIAAAVGDALQSLSRSPVPAPRPATDIGAARRVREYLAFHPAEQTPASVLEGIAGTDRYTISRQFRYAFGTSPDRYRSLRRLELARAAIQQGRPIARVAAEAGFADQSHLTRQFKRTYGLTPARWAALTSAVGDDDR
jgi:AraC-like DNA-binding protein